MRDGESAPMLNDVITAHANSCDFPDVLEYHRVTGNNCGVFRVRVSSVRHLEDLIDWSSAYELPTTFIVLSTPWVRHIIDNEHERDDEMKREESQ